LGFFANIPKPSMTSFTDLNIRSAITGSRTSINSSSFYKKRSFTCIPLITWIQYDLFFIVFHSLFFINFIMYVYCIKPVGSVGHDRMLVGFTLHVQSVPITTKVVSSNPIQARCTRYNIMW
jgi:hypothetical protein